MNVQPPEAEIEKTTFTVLVTGANSGLGFAICCRLIDEFLLTRPQSQTLHLFFSTRDTKKSSDTLRRLNAHLQKTLRKANGTKSGVSLSQEARIKLEGVLVDLTKLLAVKALAKQLLARHQHLNAVVWNAGIAGWTGVNYLKGTWAMCTNLIEATTYPQYMYNPVGLLAKPQLSNGYGSIHTFPEPRLGQIFLANVFGHYMLTHWLSPLMGRESRVIWTSTLDALPESFGVGDVQGIAAVNGYESSKRLTDLLVLTSERAFTRSYLRTFLPRNSTTTEEAAAAESDPEAPPRMYVTHPGICMTSIISQNWFLAAMTLAAFYLARWLGSPWHTISAYKGAVSAAFAVLAPPSQLSDLEDREGKGKWGSACDVFGDERVVRTEVEGLGFGGGLGVGEVSGLSGCVAARRGGRKVVTKETREEFEEAGRLAWREMEELRVEWEKRLGRVEVDGGASIDV